MNEPRRPSGPPARWRTLLRIAGVVAVALAALTLGAPYAAVAIGTRRAATCLAGYRAPRLPSELPDCGGAMQWFVTPSRLPWTREVASYRGEELYARLATASYLDAAVGLPDRGALAQAGLGVLAAQRTVKDGSQRVSMEDLGLSIGAPVLGRLAARVGDRAALTARAEEWEDWHVRLHALEAALTEGDLPLAIKTAKRYAEWDPRDEDLRTKVAALLCLSDDAARGIELLRTVQDDRASRRYAAMARDWGDVRALLVACAARAKIVPPPKPESPEAGQDDELAVRAALRLRLAAAEPAEEGAAERDGDVRVGASDHERDAVAWVIDLIEAGGLEVERGSSPRAALLASVIASRFPPDAEKAAKLARPQLQEGEPPLVRPEAMTALDWLLEARGLRPIAPAQTLTRAAERLRAMAVEPGVSEASAKALQAGAAALWIEAAKALALAGAPAEALQAIEEGGGAALGSERAIALARSSVRLLAGDVEAALAELDALGAELAGSRADTKEAAVLAAVELQRAELRAAWRGRGEDAARAALEADRAAAEAGDAALDARARFTRLALARSPVGPPLRPGTEVDLDAVNPSRRFPWVGAIEPRASIGADDRGAAATPGGESSRERGWEGPLSRSLAVWRAAVGADAPARLALRYEVLSVRGDAMAAPTALLSLASELAAEEGDVEVWLDAFMAQSARAMSRRGYAFARWQAAQWRGDADRAAAWLRRYRALAAVASDPERAEIAAFLGI